MWRVNSNGPFVSSVEWKGSTNLSYFQGVEIRFNNRVYKAEEKHKKLFIFHEIRLFLLSIKKMFRGLFGRKKNSPAAEVQQPAVSKEEDALENSTNAMAKIRSNMESIQAK